MAHGFGTRFGPALPMRMITPNASVAAHPNASFPSACIMTEREGVLPRPSAI